MYDLAAADVDGNVSDSATAIVEEQIAGLKGIQGNRGAASGLSCRVVRKADAEVCHDCHGEAGTVSAAAQVRILLALSDRFIFFTVRITRRIQRPPQMVSESA